MEPREIVLEPSEETYRKKPFTIWICEQTKVKYKDIRERFKRAPIVDDLTALIEERIEEWHQKVLESDN